MSASNKKKKIVRKKYLKNNISQTTMQFASRLTADRRTVGEVEPQFR